MTMLRNRSTLTLEAIREKPELLFASEAVYKEAINTSDFPVLLRDGIQAIMFDSFAGINTTYQQIVDMVPSNRDEEVWTELERGGTLPIVPEGSPYPEFRYGMLPPRRIRNFKRGGILSFTEEMLRFDRTNQIRQWASDFGRQVAFTRESALYSVLNTGGNYTQTSATNDIGNNTGGTTFGSEGLEVAWATLTTMKDRTSGRYLGVMPDTIIVTPRLFPFAKQYFGSSENRPVSGANDTASLGQGTMNPWRGVITNIIMSPFLGTSYQWVLMQGKRAVKWQVVDDMQILFQGAEGGQVSDAYFVYDVVRYRVRDFWGMGMYDDRFAYYSSSTAAPTAYT